MATLGSNCPSNRAFGRPRSSLGRAPRRDRVAGAKIIGTDIDIDADSVGRYPQEVEAAVYFCNLEALQNVAKYAHASRASIKLT